MKTEIHTSKSPSSKEQWVKISIEIHQHLQEALACFLIELGSSGVIVEEEILDPLSRKVITERKDHKLTCAYLKKDTQFQQKINSLDRYLKSLIKVHPLKDPPQVKLKTISEEDWNKKWQTFFTTIRAGKHIIIKPS